MNIKSILIKALIIASMMGAVSLLASAKSVTVDGMSFECDEQTGEATLTGFTPSGKDLVQVIPAEVVCDGQKYGVTVIGKNAFKGCDKITEVSIPVGVSALEEGCFAETVNLKNVSLPAGLLKIGGDAFFGSGIVSLVIPETVNELGGEIEWGESGVAGNTVSLQRFVMAEDSPVTIIYSGECSRSKSLREITLGANVANISFNSFYDLASLESVTCYATIPPTVNAAALIKGNIDNAVLYVPEVALNAYLESPDWSSRFAGRIEKIAVVTPPSVGGDDLEFVEVTIANADDGTAYKVAAVKGLPYSLEVISKGGKVLNMLRFNGMDVTPDMEGSKYVSPALTEDARFEVRYSKSAETVVASLNTDISLSAHNGILNADGISIGDQVAVYGADGRTITSFVAKSSHAQIAVPTDEVLVVKIGNFTTSIISAY